jgi:hypothetical protein
MFWFQKDTSLLDSKLKPIEKKSFYGSGSNDANKSRPGVRVINIFSDIGLALKILAAANRGLSLICRRVNDAPANMILGFWWLVSLEGRQGSTWVDYCFT